MRLCETPRSDYQSTLDAATLAMRRGELDAARTLADQGVALTRSQPDSEWAWRFTLLLSEVLIRKHDLPEAHRLLDAELPEGAAFDRAACAAAVPARLRRSCSKAIGKRPLRRFERAKDLHARGARTDDLRFDIDVLDGVIALQLGRREQGESRLNGVLRAAPRKGDRYHQAVALLNLGYGQIVQKRYDAALTWLERVLALTDQRDTTIYADALNNAGICYARLGLFERAIAAQRQAVERHKGGARREYEQALGQLGTTYLDAGRRSRRAALSASGARRGVRRPASRRMRPCGRGIWPPRTSSLGELDEAERFNNEAKRFKAVAGSGGAVYNTLRARTSPCAAASSTNASRLFEEALTDSADDPSVRGRRTKDWRR